MPDLGLEMLCIGSSIMPQMVLLFLVFFGTTRAFGIYLVVFLLYFLACRPISMCAKYLEKRWS